MVKIDKEIDTIEENLQKMGTYVIRMHQGIVDVLKEPNREKELDIMQSDEIVNHMEEEINNQACQSLVLLAPVASDLRKVVADIKIAAELERIGDYAKNIAKFLIKQDELLPHVLEYSQKMEEYMIEMLQETMVAYQNRDVEAAFQISKRDSYLNQLLKELRSHLVDHETQEHFAQQVFAISAMVRNIERAGDHIKNICEQIIYIVKGQHYDFG